jgi:hypothetical protein
LRNTALSTKPAPAAQPAEPRGWLASAVPIFALVFAALWLLHLPFLRLPYFWDEAGYFIPAARDLLLTGDLIPHTTLSNAHPPLVMLWLALCWKLAGYSLLVTRTAMLLVAASGFTALWLMARRLAGSAVAAATVLLTALSPTVFTQSAMAQLDIAAFALVLWTLYAHLCGRRWQAILFAALAAVAKETTVAVTLTLFAADLAGALAWRRWPAWAARWCLPRKSLPQAAAWLLAPLPLAGWYAYHLHRTGHVLGNPDYLRYNVGATVTPLRILIAAWMRLWHAVGYMNLFVLTIPALLLWWSARREARAEASARGPDLPSLGKSGVENGVPRNVQLLFAVVVLAQVAEFSVVGGALLARYMIPALPLVILLAVDALRRSAPRWWQWWIAASAAAFVVALLFNPPWYIAPEDNLTWTHFVEMHQQAARYAEQHYAGERILTAWPASDELNRPFLGYVQQPLTVVRVENFTPREVLRAREQEESFDVVLAFSTKFEPRRGWISRALHFGSWRRAQKRYFDYHEDLPPDTIARLLGGRIVWQESSPGEWVAVIEIDKVREAQAKPPAWDRGPIPRP